MDQIEQLGQALALIFSKLYALNGQGKVPEAIEMTNQSLKREIDLNIEELTSIPTELFVGILRMKQKCNHTNLEHIGDILVLIADNLVGNETGKAQGLNLYAKSLKIYNYLNDSDLTYSIERQSKIERIKYLLE